MKKWLKVILWSLGILLLVFLATGFAFYKRFIVGPPAHGFSAPQDLKEAQQQDLEYLALYPEYDKSFDTQEKRDSFFYHLDQVGNKLPIAPAQYEMEIAKAMAYADNSHTNISAASRIKRLNHVPLRFYWFREGLFTILVKEEYAALLGKRIIAINDITLEKLLDSIDPWHGGPKEDLKEQSTRFFLSPAVLHAIGFGKHADTLQITYVEQNGDSSTVSIPGLQNDDDVAGFWPSYWLHPYSRIQDSNWKFCKPDSLSAIPFRNVAQNVHHQFVGNTLYVQINDNYNTKERHLGKYLKSVTDKMLEQNPEKVVLDLRFNPGGNNYHLPWPFIRSVNDYLRDDQKCWIITGHSTFSAGLITAAYAKHTLGDKAIIAGEKVGDRMQFWADGGMLMQLPNSKIPLRIWTAYNDWENGCKDFSKCFWISVFDSVPAGELDPDETITLSFDDFISGKDSVLEFILN